MKPQIPAPLPFAMPHACAAATDGRPDRHGERCERLRDRRR